MIAHELAVQAEVQHVKTLLSSEPVDPRWLAAELSKLVSPATADSQV